jgi:hypothetical protein
VGRALDGRVGDDDTVDALDRANYISDVLQPLRVKVRRYFEDKFRTLGRRRRGFVTGLDYTTKEVQ